MIEYSWQGESVKEYLTRPNNIAFTACPICNKEEICFVKDRLTIDYVNFILTKHGDKIIREFLEEWKEELVKLNDASLKKMGEFSVYCTSAIGLINGKLQQLEGEE